MDIGYIQRCLRWLGNSVIKEYISNKESLSVELNKRIDDFLESINSHISWDMISRKDAQELGFVLWSKQDGYDIWLIPTYLYPIIPEGLEVVDGDGDDVIFNSSCLADDSYRSWCGYGLKIPSTESDCQ